MDNELQEDRQMAERLKKPRVKGIWDYLLALLLGGLVAVMLTQVFFRYVLNSSLAWSEELAKYLFVWMTFIGGAICLKENIHIGVDYFISLLPKRWQEAIRLFNILLVILFSGIVAVSGFVWVVITHGTSTPALGWPLNIVFYAAFPVGCMMTVYYGIKRFMAGLKQEDMS